MDVEQILSLIAATPDCLVRPAVGQPIVAQPHQLPDDLARFYEMCGGVTLYQNADYSTAIVSPRGLVPANPIIVGEQAEDDISSSWYILADDMNGDYFTIDLSRERLGRCYDSFSDRHAQIGDCGIIAATFTDFFTRMLNNRGQHWYFLQPDFVSLGDAYDALAG